jgi:hypothetical protein
VSTTGAISTNSTTTGVSKSEVSLLFGFSLFSYTYGISQRNRLSPGAIAGIALGGAIALAAIALLVAWRIKRAHPPEVAAAGAAEPGPQSLSISLPVSAFSWRLVATHCR